MIFRFLPRQRPPARVVHFTPPAYLAARAAGRGMVRVELPVLSPVEGPSLDSSGASHVAPATAERHPLRRDAGAPAESDPAGAHIFSEPPARISSAEGFGPSPGAGTAPPLHPHGAAAIADGTALGALVGHYGNPNVND